jgi:hypothetical protein
MTENEKELEKEKDTLLLRPLSERAGKIRVE